MNVVELKRCCTVCDAKKVCHACEAQTLFACSDCQVNFGATVYVCGKRECREYHERLCSGGRERVAFWMMTNGYATGHGDTIEDLLVELEGQAKRRKHQDGEATDRPTEA